MKMTFYVKYSAAKDTLHNNMEENVKTNNFMKANIAALEFL